MAKVVINKCYGGFGLSGEAYEWLIARGVATRGYVEQKRGDDGRYLPEPANDGEVIFDRRLESGDSVSSAMSSLQGHPYWENWIGGKRSWPLLVECVESLGEMANGRFAELKVVVVPDDVEFEIEEYDGREWVAERHRTWA